MDYFLDKFTKEISTPSGRKPVVLDLGCGKAVAASELAKRGCEVVAIDKQPRMTAEHASITFVQADFFAWLRRLSPNVTFDGILLRNVLQFLTQDEVHELLPLVEQHIAPRGVIGIQTFYHPTVPAFKRQHLSYWHVDQLKAFFPVCNTIFALEEPDYHPDVKGEDRQFFMTNFVVKNT